MTAPTPPVRPRERVPSDDEIQAAAVRFGYIEDGERVPPRLRARTARRINAEERAAAESAAHADTDDARARRRAAVATELAAIHGDLLEAGLPYSAADQSVAALAPVIWRTTPM